MATIETWFVTNNYYNSLALSDIISPYTVKSGETIDLLKIGNNTPENLANSIIIRNYSAKIINTGANKGKYYIEAVYNHSHEGLEVLTGGSSSDADSLHTHNQFTNEDDVSTLIEAALTEDNIDFAKKSGSVNQLSDITSTGQAIEEAVSQAHSEHIHNELSGLNNGDYKHLTDIDYTNFGTLTSGGSSDGLHSHVHNILSSLQGGDDNQYYHLTKSQYNTLTDGSNADAFHVHSGSGGTSIHNDLTGIQGGIADEYYHLTFEGNDLVGRMGEDSSGLTFDGNPIGTGVVITPGTANRMVVSNGTSNSAITSANLTFSPTTAPSLNNVLMWNGSSYVPTAEGSTFTFSITSFSDAISDTNQLIGSGVWSAIGAISFTATYDNEPGSMTAEVSMSGSAVAWGSNLSMVPTTGPTVNTEAVHYPSSAGGTITFTLSQSADGSTDTEQVSFNNTMRYGNSSLTQGNQTEASLEALATEVPGPNESRSQTISNIPTTANYLVFAYADRLTDIQQVRRNDGGGYITASFNSTRTTVAPLVQAGVANVTNSAGFSETFACITSTDIGLANGTNDFQVLTSSSTQNYIYWGITTTTSGYDEADIEALSDKTASSTKGRTINPTVGVGEYVLYALPQWLGTVTFSVDGFGGGFQSPEENITVENSAGFQEDYRVYRSTNSNLGTPEIVIT